MFMYAGGICESAFKSAIRHLPTNKKDPMTRNPDLVNTYRYGQWGHRV